MDVSQIKYIKVKRIRNILGLSVRAARIFIQNLLIEGIIEKFSGKVYIVKDSKKFQNAVNHFEKRIFHEV